MKKNKNISFSKNTWIILSVVILTGAFAASYHFYANRNKHQPVSNIENTLGKQSENDKISKNNQDASSSQSDSTGAVNKPSDPTSTNIASTHTVTPFINYFGGSSSQLEVDAYIPDIGADGTCTLTIKDGSGAVVYTATDTAQYDSQSTRCTNFSFVNKAGSKDWIATVAFSSTSYSGTSQPAKIMAGGL
jgi:flagellar basal body-associated protein FliL